MPGAQKYLKSKKREINRKSIIGVLFQNKIGSKSQKRNEKKARMFNDDSRSLQAAGM